MKKEELEKIASALQHSKDILEKEVVLFEQNGTRPGTVKYLKEELIPEIEEASKLIRIQYFK